MIYFFHDSTMPLFLLTGYAKNERDDILEADKKLFRALTTTLVEKYRKSRHVQNR